MSFRRLQTLCIVSVLGLGLPAWPLEGRLIEPSAIGIMGTLSKESFDKRYPYKPDFDPDTLMPAWYIVYKHHNLAYYFGPIRWQVTALDYEAQLAKLLQDAVLQRPSLVDYELSVKYLPKATAPERRVLQPNATNSALTRDVQPEPWWRRLGRFFF